MADDRLTVAAIQTAIREAGASWQAGTTSVSELSIEEQRMLLGVTPPPGEPTIEEIAQQIPALKAAVLAQPTISAVPTFDWRNVSGKNYVTPVKNSRQLRFLCGIWDNGCRRNNASYSTQRFQLGDRFIGSPTLLLPCSIGRT
jgi:hypothetical protein